MLWSDIEGWFSQQDAKFVSTICKQISNGIVVELGVFAGRSTAVMAPICLENKTQYYAIDNFTGSNNPRDEATQHQQNRNIRQLFDNNMKKMNIQQHIIVKQSDSILAAQLFANNYIDFCFIDADHAPKAVQKDIDAWWPKIKSNGWLGGHDYQSPLQTVVDRFADLNQLQIVVGGRCWCIKKVK